jgi:outer membrane protein OmpA-like peptidoglycan-associated protein
MMRILLLTALFLAPVAAGAQSRKAYEQAGDAAYKEKNFGAAFQHYSVALTKDPGNYRLWWKYGESARQQVAYPEAEKAYLRIASAGQKNAAEFPLLYLRLGQVQQAKGDYTAAGAYFDQFLAASGNAGAAELQMAQRERDACRWAEAQQKRPPETKIQIESLGKRINSPFSDFAPAFQGDTLYFSSYRFDKKGDKSKPPGKITRLMTAVGGGRAREPGRGLPAADSVHVAHTAFTPDGQFLFYTQCKNVSAGEIRCEIWLSVRDLRGRWSTPQRLPEPVNAAGFTATHPSVGYNADARALELWFVSDRPGGLGGTDIWKVPLDSADFCPCKRPAAGKKYGMPRFAEPQNMRAFNSPGNEATPFYFIPEQTLYFSSDARQGFGGYDIYKAQTDSAGGLRIDNMGWGINSSLNDLYLTLQADGRRGVFSSNRSGALYLDETNKACCNDLFAFAFPEPPTPKEPEPRAGENPPDSIPPAPAEPEKPAVVQDFVGLPLYFDNDEPDKRTRRTTTKKNYKETVLAYLERQEEYRLRFAAGLPEKDRPAAEETVDRFFDEQVRRGYERLDQLSELILTRLQNGETMEIVIKGFTSPRAETDYNLNLGKRRISSVRNYFDTYADGVFAQYLQSGALKVSETSFGETTAKQNVSDALEDERNSVYNPEAAGERRVEIVEIRENR